MLREYTASFTSVKPCLYQPPPGTAIEVAARPAGVKLHVPLRSTEAIAALPAATPSTPAAATPAIAPGAAKAGPGSPGSGRRGPRPRPALRPQPATSRAGGRSNDACQPPVTHPPAPQHRFRAQPQGRSLEPFRQICRRRRPPGRVVTARIHRYELMGVSSVKSRFQDGYFLLPTPRRLRVAADEDDPSGVLGIALRHSVSPAHRRGADRERTDSPLRRPSYCQRGGGPPRPSRQ